MCDIETRLSVLPSSIAALSNLEVLHAGCNPLERVEGDLIEGLSKLQELDVGFSEILEELPDAFSGCQSLQLVHAGNGRLNSLPPSLFRCEMLQELHVYGNSLKELSEELGNLVNLQVLNIGRNQITKVPDTIGKCSSLHTLHLYENCLADLPTGVTNLQNLKTLNVDSNAGMPDLPRSVRSKSGALASAEFYVTEKVQ